MRFVCVSALLTVCLFLSACSSGPKPVKVTGKLMYQGKALAIDPKGGITLTFVAVAEPGRPADAFVADINREDMSYVVNGRTGLGIPPGKYRVAISVMTLEETALTRTLNQRFTQEQSPIVRDIASEEPLVLDLALPEGK